MLLNGYISTKYTHTQDNYLSATAYNNMAKYLPPGFPRNWQIREYELLARDGIFSPGHMQYAHLQTLIFI